MDVPEGTGLVALTKSLMHQAFTGNL